MPKRMTPVEQARYDLVRRVIKKGVTSGAIPKAQVPDSDTKSAPAIPPKK